MAGSSYEKYAKAVSVGLIVVLLFASTGFAFVNVFSNRAAFAQQAPSNAVQNRAIQVSFEYSMYKEGTGGHSEKYFTGSATMTPTTGSYEYGGKGTGTLSGVDVGDPAYPCNEPQRTEYAGPAELIVNARYASGKFVPGPVTWQYRDNTTEISIEVESDNLSYHSTGVVTETGCGTDSGTYGNGFFCFFYGVDFTVGGNYQVNQEGDPDAICKLQISPAVSTLKISGNVMGNFGNKGTLGISNSKVVLAKLGDSVRNKLSVSKPDFMQKTATSDDPAAKYEFAFDRGSGELPKMLVVSLLWYEGKPEFAVTNGKQTEGRFIPVYQALCVDNDPGTKCEKWQETADGYEAVVNFEYGNAEKLAEGWSVVEPEDWEVNANPLGSGNANYSLIGSSVMMADSAFIYYNSYRAVKYFDSLGLGYPTKPVAIQSHYLLETCANDTKGAWYRNVPYPFGDLGQSLPRVDGKGGGVFLCSEESAVYEPEAPVNREWHELGHYLMYQMYSPLKSCGNCEDHGGFANDNTSFSLVEGFPEFTAAMINKYYGNPAPYIYPISTAKVNLETDYKSWGSSPSSLDEELAVAGVLWDLYDPGKEIAVRHVMNGTLREISKVYPNPVDEVSLNEKLVFQVVQKGQPRTVVDLFNSYVGSYVSKVNLDMIFLDHGFFADTVERNYVQDSVEEKSPQSGHTPARLFREHLPASLPGSFLVSDSDGSFNVTVALDQSDEYNYSYIVEMKAGQPVYFTMPPAYYPSKATITPVSAESKTQRGVMVINGDEYWNYINASPAPEGVFEQLSSAGDTQRGSDASNTDSASYIKNVRDLLNQTFQEYRRGNYTGAESLATTAYLDNFEHVEPELVAVNSTELKDDTEQMLRVELIGLIRDRADSAQVDATIAEINAKLDEAIMVVPEFPAGMMAVLASLLALTFLIGRHKKMGFQSS